MCLDVLEYASLHGVHTHCPYSNTVVKYTDINHHKTSDTECAWRFQGMHPYIVYTLIVRAQKDLFFVLLLNCRATLTATTYSRHHRTTLHALHAGANRCTNRGNARGNACKSHRRLFTRRSGHTVPFALDAAAARPSAPGTRFLRSVFAW